MFVSMGMTPSVATTPVVVRMAVRVIVTIFVAVLHDQNDLRRNGRTLSATR